MEYFLYPNWVLIWRGQCLRDELGVGATNVALDEMKKKQKLHDTCYSGDDSKNNKAL
jgi:hypothetical protein